MSKLSLRALETTVGNAGRFVISKDNQDGCELSAITLSDIQTQMSSHGTNQATTTVVGHTRYATTAEALAGTLDSVAVTPAGLKSTVDAQVAGIIQSDGWFPMNSTVTRTSNTTITVDDTQENQSIFTPRRALRFRQSGTSDWHIGIVASYTSGVVELYGAAYASTYNEVQYGALWRTQQASLLVPGDFAAAASNDILLEKGNTYEPYDLPVGRLVMARAQLKTAYGTTAPLVNILNGTNKIFSPEITATATSTVSGSIQEAYNRITSGTLLKLSTTQGAGTAGSDLTITYIVVVE